VGAYVVAASILSLPQSFQADGWVTENHTAYKNTCVTHSDWFFSDTSGKIDGQLAN